MSQISVFTRELLSLCGLLKRKQENRFGLQFKNKQGGYYTPYPCTCSNKGQCILNKLNAHTQEQETCL